MDQLVRSELPATRLIVAIDCGKVANRVMLATGQGVIGEPVSLPTLSGGIEELERLVAEQVNGEAPVIAVEATGALHRAWVRELERRFAGSVGCSRPRRPRRPARGLARAASRPTTATAPRSSASPARASGDDPTTTR
jgi:hypothetical protein